MKQNAKSMVEAKNEKIGQIYDFVQYQIITGQSPALRMIEIVMSGGYSSPLNVEKIHGFPECFLCNFLYTRTSDSSKNGISRWLIGESFRGVLCTTLKDTIRYFEKLLQKVNSIYGRDTIRKNKSFCKKVDSITIKLYTLWLLATIFSLNTEFFLYTRSKKRLFITV